MDEKEFVTGLRAELPVLGRYALSLTRGDPTRAEDAVQDALERAVRYRGSFDPARGSLRGWLLGIVTRVHATACGRTAREIPVEEATLAARPAPSPEEPAPPPPATPAQLGAALASLDDTYRLPLLLHHLQGLPCAEVAAALDLTVTAVKVRLMRGRRKLLDLLRPVEGRRP